MGITKNVVDDYRADNTGRVDINRMLHGPIKSDATGQDFVNLTFPPGAYLSAAFVSPFSIPACGPYNVTATGATISSWPFTAGHVPTVGLNERAGGTARIQTCNAGQNSVTLTKASTSARHIHRFSVGQWIMVSGWSIQGIFQGPYGFPPNFQINEFVQITAIVGNTIAFKPSLQNFYDQNWPEANRGSAHQTDAAGPATIHAMDPSWTGQLNVTGGTYNTPGGFSNCTRQFFTMNGGTSVGGPIYPTVHQIYTAIDHTAVKVDVEHDKLSDLVDIRGGTYKRWNVQSSSTRLLQMTGVTINQDLNGTTRNTIIDGCRVGTGLRIGATSYGRSETFSCVNSTVGGNIVGGRLVKGTRHRDEGLQTIITVNDAGILTVPMSCYPDGCEVFFPDPQGRNVLWWSGDNGAFASFRCLSASADNWPAADDQQATTNVSIAAGSGFATLTTSTNLFSPGDVRKVIMVRGAGHNRGTLTTFITAYNNPQSVTIYDPPGTMLSLARTDIRWGTCNMYVETDIVGGLPSAAVNFPDSGKLSIRVPAGRWVYFENCTGSDRILDLCQPRAQYKPLDSYTKREFDGQAGFSGINGPSVPILGSLVSLRVNVIQPYTGSNPLTVQPAFRRLDGDQHTGSSTFYPGKINLRIAGERIITVGNTIGTRSGDVALDIRNPNFLHGGYKCDMSRDITGESSSLRPIFSVEIITDQGFPPEAVDRSKRDRLRLR